MASGYKIVDPSGKAYVVTQDDRERVLALQEKWSGYCDSNWLNSSGDLFSPEVKIKMFLDSVAYYMMSGNMDGIETNYKSIMHAKREIPASSCTSEIENLLFATGEFGDEIAVEERARFNDMLHRLDERAEAYEIKKPQKQRQDSRFAKRTKLGIRNGEWCRVDTDGKFWFDGHQYIIDDQEIQYQPLPTEYGDYYAMDRILAANGCFYDMNYDIVNCLPIGV